MNGVKSYDDLLVLVHESYTPSDSENDKMNDIVHYDDLILNSNSNSSLIQDGLEDENFWKKFMRFFDGGDNGNNSDGGGGKNNGNAKSYNKHKLLKSCGLTTYSFKECMHCM